MKNYLILIFTSFLVACSSVQPAHQKLDNAQLTNMSNCDQIQQSLQLTQTQLADLQSQRKKASTGNAVNTAAALLSLNPFALLDNDRTGKLDESIHLKGPISGVFPVVLTGHALIVTFAGC